MGATKTDLNKEEKKRLIRKVIEKSINKINNNHVYRFGCKTYKQKQGGATGLRLTGLRYVWTNGRR